ncbi:hypothetical protein V5O48_017715 [Marasmius crinis-equi]|uniref:Uncharacterized protein n=1 Tax=Marasmius crinis-equi TaxID=585013 RepID=A0ABR3EN76_9AGAR
MASAASNKKSLKTPVTSLSRKLAAGRAIDAGVLEKLDPIERALVLNYGSSWGSHIRRKGNASPPKKMKHPVVKVKPLLKNHKQWIAFQYSNTYMEFADKGWLVNGITHVWKSFLERFPDMIIPPSGSGKIDTRNLYYQKEAVRKALYWGGMDDYGYRGDKMSILLDRISKSIAQREYEHVDEHNIDESDLNIQLPPKPFVKPRKLVFN